MLGEQAGWPMLKLCTLATTIRTTTATTTIRRTSVMMTLLVLRLRTRLKKAVFRNCRLLFFWLFLWVCCLLGWLSCVDFFFFFFFLTEIKNPNPMLSQKVQFFFVCFLASCQLGSLSCVCVCVRVCVPYLKITVCFSCILCFYSCTDVRQRRLKVLSSSPHLLYGTSVIITDTQCFMGGKRL